MPFSASVDFNSTERGEDTTSREAGRGASLKKFDNRDTIPQIPKTLAMTFVFMFSCFHGLVLGLTDLGEDDIHKQAD